MARIHHRDGDARKGGLRVAGGPLVATQAGVCEEHRHERVEHIDGATGEEEPAAEACPSTTRTRDLLIDESHRCCVRAAADVRMSFWRASGSGMTGGKKSTPPETKNMSAKSETCWASAAARRSPSVSSLATAWSTRSRVPDSESAITKNQQPVTNSAPPIQ